MGDHETEEAPSPSVKPVEPKGRDGFLKATQRRQEGAKRRATETDLLASALFATI